MGKSYTYGKQSISLGDIWSVLKVLKSPFLTQGPQIIEFEKAICDYTGAQYAVSVSNGTAALHLAMLALELKKTDEVITSPITFLASANAVLYAGAQVRFADIESETACINPEKIQKKITENTKALIPVHFSGQSCDMETIGRIAEKNNLFVVEDAAHAIGSDYKGSKVGSCQHSEMTIFSFHPVKTITTGEGGAITTNSKELYQKLLSLRCHGISNSNLSKKSEGAWYHEMNQLGFNYRLTDIQAALGLSQIKRVEKFKKKRRQIVNYYKKVFANDNRFAYLEEKECSNACFHLFPLLLNIENLKMSRLEIFNTLREKGLRLQVHYIPVHTQPYYRNLGFKEGDFPESEHYYSRSLSLPLYPELTWKDLERISTIIRKSVR